MSLCPYRKGNKPNTMNNIIIYDTAKDFHNGCYQLTVAGATFTANGADLTITITGY